jgi:hypothetical protein
LVIGDAIIMPPNGPMAGIYACNDTEPGVWKAPAFTYPPFQTENNTH